MPIVYPRITRLADLCRGSLGRSKGLVFFLLAFVALGPFARTVFAHGNPVWQEYSYLGAMDSIALGSLTALFVSRRPLSSPVILAFVGLGLALLVFCLGFEPQLTTLGLEKTGLDMSILSVGTCMIIAAAAKTGWQAPRIFSPFLVFGQRSYEIYLTHMFVVFACFNLFLVTGKLMRMVIPLFIIAIVLSGVLGELVARFYSEPANRWLRTRFAVGSLSARSAINAGLTRGN